MWAPGQGAGAATSPDRLTPRGPTRCHTSRSPGGERVRVSWGAGVGRGRVQAHPPRFPPPFFPPVSLPRRGWDGLVKEVETAAPLERGVRVVQPPAAGLEVEAGAVGIKAGARGRSGDRGEAREGWGGGVVGGGSDASDGCRRSDASDGCVEAVTLSGGGGDASFGLSGIKMVRGSSRTIEEAVGDEGVVGIACGGAWRGQATRPGHP